MFSLLNSSQIYGLQAAHEHNPSQTDFEYNRKAKSNSLPPLIKQKQPQKHRRNNSSLSDSAKAESTTSTTTTSKFFATLSSMQGMKSPTNFIEKFIRTDLLSGYDTLKTASSSSGNSNSNEVSNSNSKSTGNTNRSTPLYSSLQAESILNGFNCLQGSYRSNCDGEFYEAVQLRSTATTTASVANTAVNSSSINSVANRQTEMTIRCSKNLLAVPPEAQSAATLQNYQKLPEYAQDLLVLPRAETSTMTTTTSNGGGSSGASSGEFNTEGAGNTPASNIYKKLSFGARLAKHGGGNSSNNITGNTSDGVPATQGQEINSDNSSSSLSTNTSASAKSSEVQRSSSGSSTSQDGSGAIRKKTVEFATTTTDIQSTERIQRRKLLQMISAYDQQNKLLQRELAKEKRRRTEELACVVKSLICFESKLKTDMKSVNQRLQERDVEICRLVRKNRALRKKLAKVVEDSTGRDEGVVVGVEEEEEEEHVANEDIVMMTDCLVLEALQCINCRKQFYDIELKENCTQTPGAGCIGGGGGVGTAKECSRSNVAHNQHEHGSSSDDTVSSSFYGARRSVRYTSKRTSGTFRDYMRSRSMNIDDPALEQGSEENTSTISREDSQTSYEQLHNYARAMERMHGVQTNESSEQSSLELMQQHQRNASRLSSKSNTNSSCSSKMSDKSLTSVAAQLEEDDGIFSPTQDDDEDFEDDEMMAADAHSMLPTTGAIKIVQRRSTEFSEASPKQIYETSTDDWYASASDQEDQALSTAHSSKSYGHGAVNPVLECVNQILLQQSMEESVHESPKPLPESAPKPPVLVNSLPRRSSLSGRRSSMQENGISNEALMNQRSSSTITRKRVHFSTKNSMVHVPRNDEPEDESDATGAEEEQANQLISQNYHTMVSSITNAPTAEALNYESIYSNEYEPIGSERTSNLYVDMDAATVKSATSNHNSDTKFGKLPPALPPKPANLLKFKKSLQQLDEVADEQDCSVSTTTAGSEPDYCSISEVNMAIKSVQIVADIHNAPLSDGSPPSEVDLEVSTVASDDTFADATSQKTEEIEEIFADIPKLPNVAAIISPKQTSNKYQQHSDYLTMTTKTLNSTGGDSSKLARLGVSTTTTAPKTTPTPLKLQLSVTVANSNSSANVGGHQSQYKRKHVPNILAEINKRISLPNSPTTPKPMPVSQLTPTKIKSILKLDETTSTNLPLQAEFDWYNLDAEYGKTSIHQAELHKGNEGGSILAEIQEVSECVVSGADEYNLDEEFNMAADEEEPQLIMDLQENAEQAEQKVVAALNDKYAKNLPTTSDNSPTPTTTTASGTGSATATGNQGHKAKKIKKNLANFEKFIEGSGMSTKPLPSKRKIYFSGPFV